MLVAGILFTYYKSELFIEISFDQSYIIEAFTILLKKFNREVPFFTQTDSFTHLLYMVLVRTELTTEHI